MSVEDELRHAYRERLGFALSQEWYHAEEAAFAEYWKTVQVPQDKRVADEAQTAAWVAWLVSAKRRDGKPVANMGEATVMSDEFVSRKKLVRVLRSEAAAIQAVSRSMKGERLWGWRPDKAAKARVDAMDAATHQLAFTLLCIAEAFEGKEVPGTKELMREAGR